MKTCEVGSNLSLRVSKRNILRTSDEYREFPSTMIDDVDEMVIGEFWIDLEHYLIDEIYYVE